MKTLKVLLGALAGLVAAFVGVGLLLPDTAHVERSIIIEAPACNVYALVNGYERFNEWSPWAKLDPHAKYTYTGPSSGTGAKMSWTSDDPQLSTGSQEITASTPCKWVDQQVEFAGQGEARIAYRIAPEGGADSGKVSVTWTFDPTFGMDLPGRYFGLRMDGIMGPDFERSLASLKKVAEALPKADVSTLTVERVTLAPSPLLYVTTTCARDQVGKALGAAYTQIQAYAEAHALTVSGPPLAIYTSATDSTYTIDAGIRLASAPPTPVRVDPTATQVRIGSTPSGPMLKGIHRGSTTRLGDTHDRIAAYMAIHGLESGGSEWEEYVSDPSDTPEDRLLTAVYYPLK